MNLRKIKAIQASLAHRRLNVKQWPNTVAYLLGMADYLCERPVAMDFPFYKSGRLAGWFEVTEARVLPPVEE